MMELINFSDEDLHKFTKGFSEKRLLGKPGAFGQVYKGRNKGNNYANCPRKVAIKISERKDEYVRIMWKVIIAMKLIGVVMHLLHYYSSVFG